MRVVLDANIYVSALINAKGNPSRIILAWERGEFDVLISEAILDEIGRVLRFPRIVKRHRQEENSIQRFLRLLENEALLVEPDQALNVIKVDESDNRYLECALEGKAQYVVSGDNHLLDIGEYRGILILAPVAFVAILSRDNL
jgi:hypothetical protein